ncbi:hypothetical protein GCM10022252_74910 [Streptosporangium oxazolinicum]|uniref:Uncharacterized protein n=1 Tax=Streptosporangium oxazolinicum TaxID=909287 RepID=A0ABP8BKG9_9ACTN
MNPATKHIKDTIAALGVPRRSIVAGTDMGITSAAIHDPAHRRLVADRAEELVQSGRYGVYITRYPCGCVPRVRVNNHSRHAGQVTTRNEEDLTGHTCPALVTTQTGTETKEHLDAQGQKKEATA